MSKNTLFFLFIQPTNQPTNRDCFWSALVAPMTSNRRRRAWL